MVGLSVVLENYRDHSAKRTPQVIISKGSMFKPPSSLSSTPSSSFISPHFSPPYGFLWSKTGFLDCCFLCKHQILPSQDIYMYKGDRAFCSVECRLRQILMDEEESQSTTTNAKNG